jgi:hypothetical protein
MTETVAMIVVSYFAVREISYDNTKEDDSTKENNRGMLRYRMVPSDLVPLFGYTNTLTISLCSLNA